MVLGGVALCWDGALLSIFYFGYLGFPLPLDKMEKSALQGFKKVFVLLLFLRFWVFKGDLLFFPTLSCFGLVWLFSLCSY